VSFAPGAAAPAGGTTKGATDGAAGGGDRPRRDAARLVLGLAAAVVLAVVTHEVAVLVVVAALVVMVMLHELGHFLAAKASGMKVTEFYLGFGPRLWSVRRGETTYGVKAIPAGGYVRIPGMTMLESVDPVDEPRSYRQASFPRRLAVGLAGSAMHVVQAFVLLWAAFSFAGVPTATAPKVVALLPFVGAPSPARAAGLRPGDVIVSVDGKRLHGFEPLAAAIEASPGRPVTLGVERAGRLVEVRVVPTDGRRVRWRVGGVTTTPYPGSGPPVGVIGVQFSTEAVETVGPVAAVVRAGAELGRVVGATGEGIAQVFSLHGLLGIVHDVAHATRPAPAAPASSSASAEPLSIVGAVQVGAQALRQNVTELLFLLVEINVFVGLVNLFPLLPLDGGHVAIAVYERLRSRHGRRYHADVAKLLPVTYAFVTFILLLGLSLVYLNIVHPARLPGG